MVCSKTDHGSPSGTIKVSSGGHQTCRVVGGGLPGDGWFAARSAHGRSRPETVGVRPPLSKKLFPVTRVGKIKLVGRSGIFFFFPNFIFYKQESTEGKSKKINIYFENREKKVPVGPF